MRRVVVVLDVTDEDHLYRAGPDVQVGDVMEGETSCGRHGTLRVVADPGDRLNWQAANLCGGCLLRETGNA